MKKLKFASLFVIAALALFTFSSCKKDAPAPAPVTAAGEWTGMYGSGNAVPSNYFAFVINNNGTLKVKTGDKNAPYLGTGTWKVTDGTFTAVYSYDNDPSDKLNVAAKIDLTLNTMDGSWGFGETLADVGSFSMTR